MRRNICTYALCTYVLYVYRTRRNRLHILHIYVEAHVIHIRPRIWRSSYRVRKCWSLIVRMILRNTWIRGDRVAARNSRRHFSLSRPPLHIIEYRLFVEQRLLARSATLIASLFRRLFLPTLSRPPSVRAEARLPEISICAGVVTVCLIWHGVAYVRNKSSRVQCRCPPRKPIVYADLTWVAHSSRPRERYLIPASRLASLSPIKKRKQCAVNALWKTIYKILFDRS